MGGSQAARAPIPDARTPPVCNLPMDPYLAVSDRSQRQLHSLSLFAAALVTAGSTFLWRGYAVGMVSGVMHVAAAVFWTIGLLGMTELLRPRWRRTRTVLWLLVVYAGIGFSSFGYEGMFGEAFTVAGGSDISRLELRRGLGWSLLATMLVPGGLFPLLMIVFGVLLWRLKAIPAWCMVVLILAGISFPMGRIPRIQTIAHVSDALLLIGLAPVGWRFLQARDV